MMKRVVEERGFVVGAFVWSWVDLGMVEWSDEDLLSLLFFERGSSVEMILQIEE